MSPESTKSPKVGKVSGREKAHGRFSNYFVCGHNIVVLAEGLDIIGLKGNDDANKSI